MSMWYVLFLSISSLFIVVIFKIYWKKTHFTLFWMFDSCLVCDWTSNRVFFTCLPHTFLTCFQLNWASEFYCSWRNFPLWQLLEMLADSSSTSYMQHLFENWAYTIGYVVKVTIWGSLNTVNPFYQSLFRWMLLS